MRKRLRILMKQQVKKKHKIVLLKMKMIMKMELQVIAQKVEIILDTIT